MKTSENTPNPGVSGSTRKPDPFYCLTLTTSGESPVADGSTPENSTPQSEDGLASKVDHLQEESVLHRGALLSHKRALLTFERNLVALLKRMNSIEGVADDAEQPEQPSEETPAVPTPAPVPVPAVPTPAPVPVSEHLAINNEGKLVTFVNNAPVIVGDTSNVIAVGAAAGWTLVHLNTIGEWWGKRDGAWGKVPVAIVAPKDPADLGDQANVPKKIKVPAEPVKVGNYQSQVPNSKIKQMILSTGDTPVRVPKNFLGTHINLDVPNWLLSRNDGVRDIPKPTYPVQYVRTLVATAKGQEERGFWSNIETSQGVYDWEYMDAWMETTAPAKVIWVNYGTPSFYQKYPGEQSRWPSWKGIASPSKDMAAQGRFIAKVKERYGDRIAAFEVWNEPTFPWGNHERWSPEFMAATGMKAPFFSGTPKDLADIAQAISENCGDALVLGAAFVDVWKHGSATVSKFLRAGGGDKIDGLSVHFYDYKFNPLLLKEHVEGYRAILKAEGFGHLPIWGTETGAEDGGIFHANDARAPQAIGKWVGMAAVMGLQSIVLYGHIAKPGRVKFMSDPVNNPAVIRKLNEVGVLSGSIIREAAVLTNDQLWLAMQDGTSIYL